MCGVGIKVKVYGANDICITEIVHDSPGTEYTHIHLYDTYDIYHMYHIYHIYHIYAHIHYMYHTHNIYNTYDLYHIIYTYIYI